MNPRLELLHEMGQWLTPSTLAAIVAELNSGEDNLTYGMNMAVNIFTEKGEALVGDEFERIVNEAMTDYDHQAHPHPRA